MPSNRKQRSSFNFDGFPGFDEPRYTLVPDVFFDELAPSLSESELRVLIYVIRRTYGFKKRDDNISLKQMVEGIVTKGGLILDRGTGLAKSGVALGLKGLMEKGVLVAQRNQSAARGNEPTTYSLRFRNDPLSTKWTRGGSPNGQALVHQVDTQVTVEQESVLQETEYSNSFELLTQESKTTSTFEKSKKRDRIDQTVSQQIAEPKPQHRSTGGMKKIGELLERHTPSELATNGTQQPSQARRRGRPPKYPATEAIEAMMTDWTAELHDSPEHARSNVSQAARLWHESGVSEDTFLSLLHEARLRSKKAGNIDKLAEGEEGSIGIRNRIPYMFSCLKTLLREDLQRQVNDRAPGNGLGISLNKKGDRTTNVGYG